jgi:hypothetical protein
MWTEWIEPPAWLASVATAVMNDLQGDRPIPGLRVLVFLSDMGDAAVTFGVGLFEADGTGGGAGHQPLSPTMSHTQLLLIVADVLQQACAETTGGWGQSRPPCPYHPHPARAAERDGEAWWICERQDEVLYRIGTGEVLAAALTNDGRRRRRSPPRW